jgi:hypothetical protein
LIESPSEEAELKKVKRLPKIENFEDKLVSNIVAVGVINLLELSSFLEKGNIELVSTFGSLKLVMKQGYQLLPKSLTDDKLLQFNKSLIIKLV